MEPAAPPSSSPQAHPSPGDSLAAALKSLAHPHRLHLLRYLAEPRSLEEVASELGLARQSAQEHVTRLVSLGLVEPQPGRGDHGPVTRYLVVVGRLFDIYEQVGQRFGVVDRELTEDLRLALPTVAGPDTPRVSRTRAAGPRITIVHGMRIGRTRLLEGAGPWVLGRDADAFLGLDYDPYVSGRHAEVRRNGTGFEVADLYSRNGTSLDWQRLPRGGHAPLPEGGLLQVGRTLVLFRRD